MVVVLKSIQELGEDSQVAGAVFVFDVALEGLEGQEPEEIVRGAEVEGFAFFQGVNAGDKRTKGGRDWA